MITLDEGSLRFAFDNVVDARKFDEPGAEGHGLSHCMKAVDFIVETPHFYAFIEVKGSSAPVHELAYKYRDSFLYEWASGRAEKPCYYWVVFTNDRLGPAALVTRTDDLKRALPIDGPRGEPWQCPFAHGCGVFNIASWNKRFPDYRVTRRDATGAS